MLAGANTLAGTVTVSGGTLTVNSGASLSGGAAAVVVNGGTLNLNNSVQSVGSLSGTGGTINLGTGHTFTDSQFTTTSFAGSLVGVGNFVKSGTDTLTLSGSDNYGTTNVAGGTLQFAKQVSLYGGNTTNWTVANLVVNSGATAAFNVGGTGEFTSANIDTLKALGTGSGGFKSGSFLGLNTTNASGGVFTYSSIIANPNGGSNVLGLTKLGTCTLSLTGANTFTDNVSILGGTLKIGTLNALPITAQLSLAPGTTVDVANSQTIAGFFGPSGSTISGAGAAIVFSMTNQTFTVAMPVANTSTTFAGSVSGPGTFAVSGLGGDVVNLTGSVASTVATSIGTGASLNIASGGSLDGPITTNGTFALGNPGTQTFTSPIHGTGGLLTTAGTTTLSAASDYSGGTVISGGKLIANNPQALGTAAVTLSGGTLGLGTGITLNNPVTVNGGTLNTTGGAFGGTISFGPNGGTLAGTGAFNSSVNIGLNVTLSPGNSPGAIAFTSGLTFSNGGSYLFQVQDPAGAAGSGYDTVNVTGTLAFPATGSFAFKIQSLDANGNLGLLASVNAAQVYQLTLATATSITNFNPSVFTLDTTGFASSFGSGTFSLGLNGAGNALLLNFTPIPEPSTLALLAVGLGALALTAYRRRT